MFYVVTRGSCWLEVEGSEPVALAGGDLVVFTQRRRHQLRDAHDSEVRPLWELLPFDRMRKRAGIQTGGGGATTIGLRAAARSDASCARVLFSMQFCRYRCVTNGGTRSTVPAGIGSCGS